MVYLDNASTTKINDRVLDAMMPYLTWNYAGDMGLITIQIVFKLRSTHKILCLNQRLISSRFLLTKSTARRVAALCILRFCQRLRQ